MSEKLKKLESMIYIEEYISQNLVFRDSADKLFDYINNLEKSTIFLDFSGIGFMSRAFAHQYLKNITKMFALVKKGDKKNGMLD